MVVPDRFSLCGIQWWKEVSTDWEIVFPDRVVFPEEVVLDRLHCTCTGVVICNTGGHWIDFIVTPTI